MDSKLTEEGGAADGDDDDVKKTIGTFGNKQWLLSIYMKTKVVQHVKREWKSSERVREWDN